MQLVDIPLKLAEQAHNIWYQSSQFLIKSGWKIRPIIVAHWHNKDETKSANLNCLALRIEELSAN